MPIASEIVSRRSLKREKAVADDPVEPFGNHLRARHAFRRIAGAQPDVFERGGQHVAEIIPDPLLGPGQRNLQQGRKNAGDRRREAGQLAGAAWRSLGCA